MTDGDRPPASNDPGPSSYTNPLISGEPPFPQVSSPYEEQLMSGASSLPAYDDGAAPAAGPFSPYGQGQPGAGEQDPGSAQQPYNPQQSYGEQSSFGTSQPYAPQPPYSAPQPPYGQPLGSTGNQYPTPSGGSYGYQAPGYGLAVGSSYGVDPVSGLPYSDKSKLVAGLLGIFLGSLGVGRFYMGNIGMGVMQLLVTIITFGVGGLWGFIDGIVILAGNPRDSYGRPLRP